MASTNGQSSSQSFLPKVSSDNNANPNNIKSTGAIPKVKLNSVVPNGLNSSEIHVKLNNNLHQFENGTSSSASFPTLQQLGTFTQINVNEAIEKACSSVIKNSSKISKKGASKSGTHLVINGVLCKDESFNQLSSGHSQNNSVVDKKNRGTVFNGHFEQIAGPSTSSNNIRVNNSAVKENESDSDCSSDTGNDDLSCSDECCIYTYKGDVAADLPSSFMNLEIPDNNDLLDQSRNGSRASSPEMDFLEMDFDPGPSCDADSDESSVHSDNIKSDENVAQNDCNTSSPQPVMDNVIPDVEMEEKNNIQSVELSVEQESTAKNDLSSQTITNNVLLQMELQVVNHLRDEPWIPKSRENRTIFSNSLREAKGHHNCSGDLVSPNENNGILSSSSSSSLESRINTSSSLYHSTMEKQLVHDKQEPTTSEDAVPTLEKTMIWSEQEAAVKQVTQISTSACGATAVLNVLQALGYPTPHQKLLLENVKTKLRLNFSPITEYLKSRSVAGCTHKDIIRGLYKLSNGKIYARFFHMYPERYISLSKWLSYWIKKGAVPIATLNLQKDVKQGDSIPDAWHHQMIFGVAPHGIYMTNPLERVEEGVLWHQLVSESVLRVKREDVISRWINKPNLRDLINMRDVRWEKLNVVGQVANVIREHHTSTGPSSVVSRTHVSIPAAYSAGVTLAINMDNPACEILKHCPELPVLNALP